MCGSNFYETDVTTERPRFFFEFEVATCKGQLISKCPFGPNDEIKRTF